MQQARKSPQRSLSEDLQPLMRLLQLAGHFMPEYEKGPTLAKAFYSLVHISLGVLHFVFLVVKLLLQFGSTVALISNTLTMLFFLHGITKVSGFFHNNFILAKHTLQNYALTGALLCRKKKAILRNHALLGRESLAPSLPFLGQQAPVHFHHRNETPAAASAARHRSDDFHVGHPPIRW